VVDEVMMQLAMRVRAMTLSVATTSVMSLSATSTGYARASGSFQADGFWPGMELVPAGFATNTPRVITFVTPLAITVSGSVPVEGAAGGRSLTVGLPSQRAWENVAFEATAGVPWVREEFLPGPVSQVTLGPLGELVVEPQYLLHVNVPEETSLTVKRYITALRTLFAPRTAIALANGDVLRVRSDTAPFPSQLQQSQTGFAEQLFSVPLRLRTNNVI
jgi:hypothetical protein